MNKKKLKNKNSNRNKLALLALENAAFTGDYEMVDKVMNSNDESNIYNPSEIIDFLNICSKEDSYE